MSTPNEVMPVSPSADAAHDLEEQHGNMTLISTLAVSDDPFAPREGKTLLWKNVNMTLVSHLSNGHGKRR